MTKYFIFGCYEGCLLLSSGIGAGAASALFGDLARTTRKELRTTVFSVFMAMRQLGLVVGKAMVGGLVGGILGLFVFFLCFSPSFTFLWIEWNSQ